MNKYSNFEMPAASGPGGPKNIELTGNEEAGVSKKDAKKLLDEVKSSNDPQKLTERITSVADNVQNKDLQKKLYHLSDTTQMASDPKKRTKDPQTGELDPGPDQYADKIAREFLAEVKAVYNFRESQKVQQRKKKTRGNPFRVLMGKVGKLLDHGVEKNDIVRTIAKLKFWEKPMIEKAVEIVQDYNRKQRSKKDDNEKTALNEKTVNLEELQEQNEQVKKTVDQLKDLASEGKKTKTAAIDYDRKPDFKKRSTGELVARVCYLLDLQDYSKNTKQGDFKDPESKKGVTEELKQIKSALVDRGFDKEELSMLGLGN
jgi:hypothetical protein